MLLRRPDVVEAEYLLRAANADIGVARAELFPRISLTGLLGPGERRARLAAQRRRLPDHARPRTSAYTIFDAGGRRANVAVSEAQRDAALAAYERAIQTAFREVADALAVQGTIGERAARRARQQRRGRRCRQPDRSPLPRRRSTASSPTSSRSAASTPRGSARRRSLLAGVRNRIDLYRALGSDAARVATAPAEAN